MATLDAVLLVVCCASLMLGAWRGLVYELFTLVGWVAAFWIARLFAGDVGAWLPVDGFDPTVRYAAGFVAVFVVNNFIERVPDAVKPQGPAEHLFHDDVVLVPSGAVSHVHDAIAVGACVALSNSISRLFSHLGRQVVALQKLQRGTPSPAFCLVVNRRNSGFFAAAALA